MVIYPLGRPETRPRPITLSVSLCFLTAYRGLGIVQLGRGLRTCSRGYISILAQEELWDWRNAAGKKEVWHQRNPTSVRKWMDGYGLFSPPQQLLPAHYYHLRCPTVTKSFSLYPTKASLFSPFAPLYPTHALFWHHYYQSFLTFCPSLTRPFSQVHLASNVPL